MHDTLLRSLRLAAVSLAVTVTATRAIVAQELETVIVNWEAQLDARIGVLLRDVSSDWQVTHRADERFAMSSTFKPLLCGAVLAQVDAGREKLSQQVTYQTSDLVPYSPVTEQHVDTGMTVAELCEATLTISDNTAANLLLRRINGPKGLTGFLRKIGDTTTRLDRLEPMLNDAVPGDLRDTTTPRAILASLEKLLFTDILQPQSALQLQQWMIDDQVAGALIRAHVPDDWQIGDKSGAGGHGSRGIIAFLRAPDGETYLAAIYLTESQANFSRRNEVIADIGRAMIARIQNR